MPNLNKFFIFRPKKPTYLIISQTNQIFYDRTPQCSGRTVSKKHDLSDVNDHKTFCINALVYIFSNLNLLLNVANRKASYFKHRYNYTFHDYCATKNKFVKD